MFSEKVGHTGKDLVDACAMRWSTVGAAGVRALVDLLAIVGLAMVCTL